MCGVAGILMRDGSAPDPATLDRLLAGIAHRGPDGTGRLVRGPAALLHARLAIIDLETGDQPLFAPGGTALIANGEIYGNPELRATMAGTPFRTRSDCEPAVFLYERDGEGFAAALRGMYALALHDEARGRLVLARDPFGIKPLYTVANDRLVAFASEPAALAAAGLVPRPEVPDPHRLAELLQLKFTTGRATIWPGVDRVLPGETRIFDAAGDSSRQVAALPAGPPVPIRHAEALDRLDAVLRDSVAVHLRSDVPYGLFLSGGIDSASLLALMHRLVGGRIQALTIGWEGGAADESHEALRLARSLGADCERLVMTEADFLAHAPAIAACLDDPTADGAALPTWMLGRAARQAGLKVTLCGEGGDEMFGGYARYRKRRAPLRWVTRAPRTRGVFKHLHMDPRWRDGLTASDADSCRDRSAVQAAQAADIAEWLPNDLLVKLDRCLMVHGVEGRTPFLDPAVADFAFRLPDHEKLGLRLGKKLLREWLAREVPQAAAGARKRGFKPPLGRWMAARRELPALVAAAPVVASLFTKQHVTDIFAHAEENSQPAWSLLFLALWHAAHGLGVDPHGSIDEVLAEAARRG